MNHAYKVKALVPMNGNIAFVMYKESYTIVAPNAAEACRKAVAKAKRDTGYHGSRWRITELQEHAEPL